MINFCILYWDMGCEIRKHNSIISWFELKKMTSYLKSRGLNINAYLFEFGNNFVFEDSIKINDQLEYYEKSKKNNLAINHNLNDNSDFIAIMDSDLFFDQNQYEMIYNHLTELNESVERKFFTYNLLDIHCEERNQIIDFEKNQIKYEKINELRSKYSWRHSFGTGVLGGIFIVPTLEIRNMGGFNENFLTWGAEDDEAFVRMKNFASWYPKMNEGPYHLWHPKNETDNKYYIPVYSEEYFKINKVEKPK